MLSTNKRAPKHARQRKEPEMNIKPIIAASITAATVIAPQAAMADETTPEQAAQQNVNTQATNTATAQQQADQANTK